MTPDANVWLFLLCLSRSLTQVLYRPFHELNKRPNASPFWWSNRDPSQYRQVWVIMHGWRVLTGGSNPMCHWDSLR